MAEPPVKGHFKVSEGRYVLHTTKALGLVRFAMRRTSRLTIATLHGGEEEGMYMVYNVGDYLHVAPFDATDKVGAGCWGTAAAALVESRAGPQATSKGGSLARHWSKQLLHAVAIGSDAGLVVGCRRCPLGKTPASHTRHDPTNATHLQEPLVSLIFNPSAVRDGFPACHAYKSCKDGVDLVVGIANGEGEAVGWLVGRCGRVEGGREHGVRAKRRSEGGAQQCCETADAAQPQGLCVCPDTLVHAGMLRSSSMDERVRAHTHTAPCSRRGLRPVNGSRTHTKLPSPLPILC
jgi:hypothetical protein